MLQDQQQAIYKTNPQPTKAINLAEEYPLIPPEEIRDVLTALMLIYSSTGWGEIKIQVVYREVDNIKTQVDLKRKSKKKVETK